MLEGSFRIGTLAEFRSAEIDSGAFSDLEEGEMKTSIGGDVRNFHGAIGGIKISNLTMIGFGSAIRTHHQTDGNAFCTSIGPYRRDRHERLMSVSADYKGNADWTAHLVLDTRKLLDAFVNLAASQGVRYRICARTIRYGERHGEGRQEDIPTLLNTRERAHRQLDAIFTKPPRFELEEEVRFLVLFEGRTAYQTIWTRESAPVAQAFREAIHSEGSSTL